MNKMIFVLVEIKSSKCIETLYCPCFYGLRGPTAMSPALQGSPPRAPTGPIHALSTALGHKDSGTLATGSCKPSLHSHE